MKRAITILMSPFVTSSVNAQLKDFVILGGELSKLQMCWWGINYLPAAQGSSVHVYSMPS